MRHSRGGRHRVSGFAVLRAPTPLYVYIVHLPMYHNKDNAKGLGGRNEELGVKIMHILRLFLASFPAGWWG